MPNAAGIAELRRENAGPGATVASLEERLAALRETAAALKDQVDWFKRQLFGRQSEKRVEFDLAEQASLFDRLGVGETSAPEVPVEEISYRRRRKVRGDAVNECGLRFDATVPVTTIEVKDPEVESIPMSERVVVGEKVTHRLAQRPASYEVLRYVRPVVKRRGTGELLTARAPANVLERTAADASLLAGMLVDKFRHHLPPHRQHRRMSDAGIAASRSSLTNWAGRAIDLLRPIAAAHVLDSCVLAMDETPVKAGVKEPGKMHQGCFWPIHGEDDEIVFPFARAVRPAAAESAGEGAEVRAGPRGRAVGVPVGPRRGDRHQSSGARPPADPDGPAELAVRLDRTGCRARRRGPGSARDLPTAGRGSAHLSGRRAAARRTAPRRARRRAHAAGVEDAVRRRPAALRPRAGPRSAPRVAGPKTRLPLRGLVRTTGRTENDLRPREGLI